MEIKSSVPAGNLSHQDKFLKSLRSFSTIVRRTTISTTTIVRKTLTKLPAAFLGNFSPVDGGGGEGVGVGKKEEKENSSCYSSPTPPVRPPKPHPGQKVRETPLGVRRRALRAHHHHHHQHQAHHQQAKRRKPRLLTPPDSPDWVVHFPPTKTTLGGKTSKTENEEVPFPCSVPFTTCKSDSNLKYNLSSESFPASKLILPLTLDTNPGSPSENAQTWCSSRNVSGGKSGVRAEESDDSGRGTCEQSDASDFNNFSDFNNCDQSDFSDGSPKMAENRRKTSQSLSLKRSSYPISTQKSQNWSQRGLDAKISVLNGERCGLDRELEIVCNRLGEIEGALAKVGTYREVKKLQSYVANSEKTTLLLHGIARRMAKMEMSREMMMFTMVDESRMENLTQKIDHLSSQLEDAKEISSMVNRRLPVVLESLEAKLGEEMRNEFVECLDKRSQLLVARKELEDKIEMEERLGFLTVL